MHNELLIYIFKCCLQTFAKVLSGVRDPRAAHACINFFCFNICGQHQQQRRAINSTILYGNLVQGSLKFNCTFCDRSK